MAKLMKVKKEMFDISLADITTPASACKADDGHYIFY